MSLVDQTLEYWINLMRQIAVEAHKGQLRKDNKTPYIEHVLAVAAAVEDRLKPIALGHDLVEDTTVTLQDLIEAGFPSYVTDAIDLLTHRKSDMNMVYWKRMLTNRDVVTVKIEDIKCNLNDNPSDYQIQKYTRALKVFSDAGYDVN